MVDPFLPETTVDLSRDSRSPSLNEPTEYRCSDVRNLSTDRRPRILRQSYVTLEEGPTHGTDLLGCRGTFDFPSSCHHRDSESGSPIFFERPGTEG